MRSTLVLRVLALWLILISGAAAFPEGPRFAQESSDLKADPAAKFGKLPNGIHYVILANKEPKARASLRFVVVAGSLQETDEQRGLAHFLEHMAFNGSTHYPPGTLIEYFQRHGMNFGGDTNAYTSFDRTVYMLELPDTKAQTLEEGFKLFSDYAGGLLLTEAEINKERGIILSEKRARDSVEYRQSIAEFEFLLPESSVPKRMPIGVAEVIENAQRPLFADFYDTWYRPERIAIVAVGDFDPALVEKQIVDAFSSQKARAAARPNPNLGKTSDFTGLRVKYHHDPEASTTTVGVQVLTPYTPEPDTAAYRIKDLPRTLAAQMLSRRLAILAKKENASFTQGSAVIHEGFDFFHNAGVEVTCKPEQWTAAMGVVEQELRRALEHGFQAAELSEASANMDNQLDQAAKTASTRHSDQLAEDIIDSIVHDEVFTTPADDLALLRPALKKISVEDCTSALREAFAAPGRFLTVLGNAKIDGDATAAITSVYEKSAAQKVAAPEKISDASFAYTDFGSAGKIKDSKHVEDLDVTLATFANGVRLNLKKTEFEAGKIHVSVRFGTGQLTEPKDQPGLAFLTSSAFTAGGLGKHSIDDLQRLLAGKTVGTGFKVDGDAFVFNVTTNSTDLLLQFQLLAAYLTDPGYRPESLRIAQKKFEQLYIQLEHTPDGPLKAEVTRLLASGDKRFGLPPKNDVLARTLDEVRTWLTPQLSHGPIEIAVVGDLDQQAVINAVAQTLGALPERIAKPALEAERKAVFPAPFTREFKVVTEIPTAVVAIYWPSTDGRDIRVVRRLRILSDVFTDRLRVKVREELGESYSPQAASFPSDTYRDYGIFLSYMTVDPTKSQAVADAVLKIADDLAQNGINDDELDRAKKPVITSLRDAVRNNGYWLNSVLGSVQEFPQRLDWSRNMRSDYEAITTAEIEELAKKYLPSARSFRVTVLPEKK